MRILVLLVINLCLLACSPAKQDVAFYGTDITGADFANQLSLTDHHGNPRTLEDFKGKAAALFFGFTHCPDVCPTTMSDLAAAMKLMGPRGDEVQVLFVTLDPERDTQQVLAEFVPAFDSRFLGLYGTPEQIANTASNFKVFYAKQQSPAQAGYNIDHSAGIYVFDKQGKIRLYIKFAQKPDEIAHDLLQIL